MTEDERDKMMDEIREPKNCPRCGDLLAVNKSEWRVGVCDKCMRRQTLLGVKLGEAARLSPKERNDLAVRMLVDGFAPELFAELEPEIDRQEQLWHKRLNESAAGQKTRKD